MCRLLSVLVWCVCGSAGAGAQASPVTLTYLGNMGVLLEAGQTRIVVDGLHRGGLAEYEAVPPRILDPLERGQPPYAALTAALTTHLHKDHFDARSVMTRLRADSAIVYGAAQETLDTLLSRAGASPMPGRVRAVVPEGPLEQQLAEGIVALALPHNPTPSRRVANVGFLLELDGLHVLHVGDADPTAATFAPHHLATRGVDVAIVPFWYLTGGDDTVRRLIGARVWVATHIPPADGDAVREMVLRAVPEAIVLTRPGERHVLR
jgi:L-ascorbate metabolism protein UlaG (beta-lactamase superfamily)